MSTFIMLLIAASFIYLIYFYKPHHHSEADLKKWFSGKLIEIAENIEIDIEKDNKGEYRHAGLQTFEKQGKITYLLVDKNYARFDPCNCRPGCHPSGNTIRSGRYGP